MMTDLQYAEYLLGMCIPLLQILDENEQAVEVLSLIREFAAAPVAGTKWGGNSPQEEN